MFAVFQVSDLQKQLKQQTDRCDGLSEQLATAETQSKERATTIDGLTEELERLRQGVKVLVDHSLFLIRSMINHLRLVVSVMTEM